MEIALALSGGGYRAAVYHIGVMSYLNKLQFGDSTTLLDYVNILTGVSGGALTALYYACIELAAENRAHAFRDLYSKIVTTNVGSLASDRFSKEAVKGKDMIEILADVYEEAFLTGLKFETILEGVQNSHLHHVTVNATDFSNGLPFRFQATKALNDRNDDFSYGWIGNFDHRIDREVASQLRLSDILAASSCFPIAFEPILYPKHFVLPTEVKREIEGQTFGMMDGGMIDNQGIDSVLKADEQMQKSGEQIDLVIISDVSSLKMDGYLPSKKPMPQNSIWSRCKRFIGRSVNTVSNIQWTLKIIACTFIILGYVSYNYNWNCWAFIVGFVLSSLISLYLIDKFIEWVNGKISSQMNDFTQFNVHTEVVKKVRFGAIKRFFLNRVRSAYVMANGAMMGHIRRKNVSEMYEGVWRDRTILNPLYCLEDQGTWVRSMLKYQLPTGYKPSLPIIENSTLANSMGTTLWFSKEHIANGMPEAILCSGQYTTCWNLMKYIEKTKEAPTEASRFLSVLEVQLKRDWVRFCENPKFLSNLVIMNNH